MQKHSYDIGLRKKKSLKTPKMIIRNRTLTKDNKQRSNEKEEKINNG